MSELRQSHPRQPPSTLIISPHSCITRTAGASSIAPAASRPRRVAMWLTRQPAWCHVAGTSVDELRSQPMSTDAVWAATQQHARTLLTRLNPDDAHGTNHLPVSWEPLALMVHVTAAGASVHVHE